MMDIRVNKYTDGDLDGWDPNQVDGAEWESDRAARLFAALGTTPADEEMVLAVAQDGSGRLALFGLSVEGHPWAEEVEDDEDEVEDDEHPAGAVDWNSDPAATYVVCCYGPEGDDPGDCYARVGQDERGRWWVDDGDDDERVSTHGPFEDETTARDFADALATEQDEAQAGENAADMVGRREAEALERGTPDGGWCVAWYDPDRREYEPGNRYDDQADAVTEISVWERGVLSRTPTALIHCMKHPLLARVDDEGHAYAIDEESGEDRGRIL